jgi:SAM-dependent methyltransferase
VQRVHYLLKTELGRSRGLADPEVVVLDPCCGTGAYLLEVARCIAAELKCAGDESALGLELARAFHERVMGFEILTAPFAIAQLQLYLLLDEFGSTPDEKHRVAIFLTNALSGWHDAGDIKLNFPEMREEFDASQRARIFDRQEAGEFCEPVLDESNAFGCSDNPDTEHLRAAREIYRTIEEKPVLRVLKFLTVSKLEEGLSDVMCDEVHDDSSPLSSSSIRSSPGSSSSGLGMIVPSSSSSRGIGGSSAS